MKKGSLICGIIITILIGISISSCKQQSSNSNIDTTAEFEFSDSGFVWNSPVPDDSPFEMSSTFTGIFLPDATAITGPEILSIPHGPRMVTSTVHGRMGKPME
jgi:hypothetical protein